MRFIIMLAAALLVCGCGNGDSARKDVPPPTAEQPSAEAPPTEPADETPEATPPESRVPAAGPAAVPVEVEPAEVESAEPVAAEPVEVESAEQAAGTPEPDPEPAPEPAAADQPDVVDPGGAIAVAVPRAGLTRIGADKCKMCHKVQYESWQTTAHAQRTPPLDCEDCHGPGSEYKAPAIMKDPEKADAAGLVRPDSGFCQQCHQRGWSDDMLLQAHAHKN